MQILGFVCYHSKDSSGPREWSTSSKDSRKSHKASTCVAQRVGYFTKEKTDPPMVVLIHSLSHNISCIYFRNTSSGSPMREKWSERVNCFFSFIKACGV